MYMYILNMNLSIALLNVEIKSWRNVESLVGFFYTHPINEYIFRPPHIPPNPLRISELCNCLQGSY